MTIEFFEFINYLLNHPIETVIFFIGCYAFYKLFIANGDLARDFRRDIKFSIENLPSEIYYKLFENTGSFAGLKSEKIQEALLLIARTKQMSYHGLYHFLRAQLNISKLDTYRIVKALENTKKIENKEIDGRYVWRLKIN